MKTEEEIFDFIQNEIFDYNDESKKVGFIDVVSNIREFCLQLQQEALDSTIGSINANAIDDEQKIEFIFSERWFSSKGDHHHSIKVFASNEQEARELAIKHSLCDIYGRRPNIDNLYLEKMGVKKEEEFNPFKNSEPIPENFFNRKKEKTAYLFSFRSWHNDPYEYAMVYAYNEQEARELACKNCQYHSGARPTPNALNLITYGHTEPK